MPSHYNRLKQLPCIVLFLSKFVVFRRENGNKVTRGICKKTKRTDR